ncbi:hypothetical protein [Pseudoclavibacter sp. 8L]|uniref:hypothetical protein n=1 Tax=Pseudoclavibacter sp. 8L TaxID=2653162 RepID=UPI0012F20B6A|nr:hypothetical protein [Pseudoclavibacter sp. 8L]VXB32269.1 conserved hypothetical protein [Pseudoclavibacter sp. 8L]
MPVVIKTPGASISGELTPADPILTNGSLLLVEPAHPRRAWASGVPAQNATIPNVARTQASALLGVAPSAVEAIAKNTITATEGVVERTAKGGVNTVVSQTAGTFPRQFGIAIPESIRTYIATNKANRFYMSLWFRPTKNPATGTTWRYAFIIPTSSATTASITGIAHDGAGTFFSTPTASDARRLGATEVRVGVNRFQAVAANGAPSSGWTAAVTSAFEQIVQYGARLSGEEQKSPSGWFYRVYIEDLTVSGRSFDQVRQRDQALWTGAFGTGGRYEGDSAPTPSV